MCYCSWSSHFLLFQGIVSHLKFLWVKSRNWILIYVLDREVRICHICTGYRKLNFPENGSRHQFWLIEWLQLKWGYSDISAPFYWYKYRCVIVSEALGSCFAVILIHLIYFWTNRDVCRAKMFLNLRRNGIGKNEWFMRFGLQLFQFAWKRRNTIWDVYHSLWGK